MTAFIPSHIELAHAYWKSFLQIGDGAIDATCGNGQDALYLAKILLKGNLICLDIQKEAIEKTRIHLKRHLDANQFKKITLLNQCHSEFPVVDFPIKLVVYNLGYLPGGDKDLTTEAYKSIKSVGKALTLLMPGGGLSITCYPGHEEGEREEKDLLAFISTLDPKAFRVCHHCYPNSSKAPSLLLIQKKHL